MWEGIKVNPDVTSSATQFFLSFWYIFINSMSLKLSWSEVHCSSNYYLIILWLNNLKHFKCYRHKSIFSYKWELLNILNQIHKFIESALIICCFNYIIAQLSLSFFLLQQIIIWQTVWCFTTLMFIIAEASRINTNLFVLQCVSFCRVLDLSCSLCPSINSVSADFTSSWCSDARLHL